MRLHASARRSEPPSVDEVTGEVRVPLALYEVDVHRGDLDLVLSRSEVELLLGRLLAKIKRGPVAVL
ncbi:hypothetical protein [Streptomyces sp. NPDC020607]|uniref:hypothetical protein n=1 Tax=Streptomyces sp. NPDC020607 TaxID=3365082 RepID=UPI0037906DED